MEHGEETTMVKTEDSGRNTIKSSVERLSQECGVYLI
jgi:hypothetical protein